ncbi:YicC/YloC family endoribonuclease [Algiphilus aromaticivorans]|uniref:YicC/YloC family endoribonuclease n=1 Tax=Algiphilus aromaticivorans TaxID=382454 RepID=UPI001E61DE88|nr:YicC/YloC family endoribonuclease [Algiphilus aromaticivorans]
MTGFAQGEAEAPGGSIRWEIRSVNHRYLDIGFRMPEEFRALEGELRQRAGRDLARGKVEAQMRYLADGAASAFEVDEARLNQLKAAIDHVERAWGALETPDPLQVLQFPGVVREQRQDLSALHEAATQAFDAALADLRAARAREGERLAQVLVERCDALENQVGVVRERLPQVREGWLDKLRERCRDLGVEADQGRLEQELALVAQRADVDEEMVRLAGHIEEVRATLAREEATGRRLDFLMQELNREANTLSSKSQDAELTRGAVEMKVIIEQMREQVQNIE